jgi:plasmid stabilization system protein ParE
VTGRRILRVGRSAAAQISEIAAWWRVNRPAAPSLFVDELSRAYDLIRHQPNVGQPVVGAKSDRLRRIHLLRSRHHLYYQESEDGDAVEVLAVWHTSRGTDPDL